MYTEQWPGRKRERDDDEDNTLSGFSEHRSKRRLAALPHRVSPKIATSSFTWNPNTNYTSQPATITPVESDSEEAAAAEPRSFFSPYSSSPTTAGMTQSGSPSPYMEVFGNLESSQSHVSDAAYSDVDMMDTSHLSPGPFHNDPATSISGRIPTPIHSSFAPFVRPEKGSRTHEGDVADGEELVDRFRRGRRLPSPISEGETSPSVIVAGFHDMQMDVEQHEPGRETPTKKGHTRSKHSLRNWTGNGFGPEGAGTKKTFSMGYRADCEKCRMKVPGHFSHIITY